jgi:hypothetical protein
MAYVASRRQTRADLLLTSVRLFNVTVNVIDDLGWAVPDAEVFATASRLNYSKHTSRQTGQDGSVMIGPTLPGPVQIVIQATKDNRHLEASATIEVRDAPIDVTVPLVASATIIGRVEFIGRVAPLHNGDSANGLRVIHAPPGVGPPSETSRNKSGLVSANGEFMLTHALGEQCLRLSGIPAGWRLRNITYNDRDYTYRPFSVESGDSLAGVVIRVEPGDMVSQPRVCSR